MIWQSYEVLPYGPQHTLTAVTVATLQQSSTFLFLGNVGPILICSSLWEDMSGIEQN